MKAMNQRDAVNFLTLFCAERNWQLVELEENPKNKN